ncbi:MAG: tRNA (adenosine(37)-N6)-threonylcarbamoyltransferase complex transferase subunit TsaD [Blastochloris sp.]|nr:tRNA (adenosine(37)-N6)-threonylcarbamoyltransferase complex transferase subunit TsaD [Blastochloris sp.]
MSYVKGLALATDKPWVGVNHLEGHLISPFLSETCAPIYPHIALIVSGGHTQLLQVLAWGHYELLGGTLDDAVGEAFDKVAKMLKLPYPGGPQIEVLARNGNPQSHALPRSMLESGDLSFSFSGLKTSVRVLLEKEPDILDSSERVADLCASFQEAVIEVLTLKTRKALRSRGVRLLTLSGGVSCNQALVTSLREMCARESIRFLTATPRFSTDNAAMIGAAGLLHLAAGRSSLWDQDVDPNLKLANG